MNDQKDHNLTDPEKLQLLQLLELTEWPSSSSSHRRENGSTEVGNLAPPYRWSMLQNAKLLPWQEEALDRWSSVGYRGIAKVVTGAGKTVFALAAVERLQQSFQNLRVAIVVPTVVLMSQWYEEIISRSNLPPSAIGMLGGGSDEKFSDKVRILICVLNSAARKLPNIVSDFPEQSELFLIVDECHRAGASEMRKVFNTPNQFILGLSATPERDDFSEEFDSDAEGYDSEKETPNSILEKEIGPIFFEMNYAEAIEQGVLPAFSIEHYAVSLNVDERRKYEALSQEITDLRKQLETRTRRGLALIRWCRSAAGAKDPRATRLIALISQRKQFLYRIEQRLKAVERLVADSIQADKESRIIIFHESIAEVMNIFVHLRHAGYRVVAEHSELPDRIRAKAISLFRSGVAQVVVSAKSLIEGFNVPSADIGIVAAASSSVRQRVQTLGRLLRRSNDKGKKRARLVVLFAENTVDDRIYEKANWNSFVGAERNEYFQWTNVEADKPVRLDAPPREYVPADFEIDPATLQVGQSYPGKLEGDVFTIDTGGTVLDPNRHPIRLDSEIVSRLSEFRGGGRFMVTPKRHYVIKPIRDVSSNGLVFIGQLPGPLRVKGGMQVPLDLSPVPGAEYPIELAVGKTFSVLQRDGRLIARKDRGRPIFVKHLDKIAEIEKRSKLEKIQAELRSAYKKGHLISRIFVNDLGHAGYVHGGIAYFLGEAPEGGAGFVFEEQSV